MSQSALAALFHGSAAYFKCEGGVQLEFHIHTDLLWIGLGRGFIDFLWGSPENILPIPSLP